jgi:DUF1680 family protein
VNRRDFLGTVAAGGAAMLSPLARAAGAAATPPAPFATATARRIVPFAPGHVTLGAGPAAEALARNRRYLESLPVDRLLHMYRVTAGISSSAEPVGGWEKPDCELRGHFTGHYLSACALMKAYAGDDELAARAVQTVQALAACQQRIGNGYLGAYPEELYDRLKAGRRVWAPFYTYHKILAGHLDLYRLTGNSDALQTAERMAQWVGHWLNGVSEAHLQRILQTEYGGMNEVLYNLAETTGKEEYLRLGHRFAQPSFFDPLAEQRDELQGLHVNTQIPKVIGAARRYELTVDRRYRQIAEYFWHEVVHTRSYCIGNTSNHEGWRTPPGVLSTELSDTTAECCCAYNMLKLTRLLFMWTGDPQYADYYERALFNCRLGTQHPVDGRLMYYFPLASGYWKLYGSALDSFWCCTGTGVEEFSRLADSIYFSDADDLYVNLFIASEVRWDAKGVRVRQDTRFPADDTISLRVDADRPVAFTLRVRIPYWTAPGGRVALNGAALPTFASAGSYLTLTRTWQSGDRVEVTLPMELHRAPMPDDRRVQAIMYGPLVLAGRLGSSGLTEALQTGSFDQDMRSAAVSVAPIDGSLDGEVDWIEPVKGERLSFRTVGQHQDLALAPVSAIHGERYAVYWHLADGA